MYNFRSVFVFLAIVLSPCSMPDYPLLQSAMAAPDDSMMQSTITSSVEKAPTSAQSTTTISQKGLEKYKSISITVNQDGKEVKYSGVPVRVMLAEMLPAVKLDSMPAWKALSRRELVLVARSDDNYPGLVTAIELAINMPGDRFVLATHRDGKLIETGVQLICKADEAHTRWVRNVVSLRLVDLTKSP